MAVRDSEDDPDLTIRVTAHPQESHGLASDWPNSCGIRDFGFELIDEWLEMGLACQHLGPHFDSERFGVLGSSSSLRKAPVASELSEIDI